MTAPLLQNVAVLLCFWFPRVQATPCDLSIRPVDPAVPFGGSATLNCTDSCANNTELKWEFSAQGDIRKGQGWTSVSFDNITVWDLQPVCFGDPAKDPVKMPVYLYQFPSPDIYLASDIVAGRPHAIVCNVSSLKVRGQTPRSITVSLSGGGRMLNSSRGGLSVEFTSVAQLNQDGTEILCVAHLEVGKEVLEKTANSTLKVSAGPYNVSVTSSVTTYEAGSHITVTCRADGNPLPEFVWQLPSTDHVEFSDSNRTVTVRSAQSSHNGTYRCCAQNAYGSYSVDINILYSGTSRSRTTAVVVAVLVLLSLLATAGVICYKCRK